MSDLIKRAKRIARGLAVNPIADSLGVLKASSVITDLLEQLEQKDKDYELLKGERDHIDQRRDYFINENKELKARNENLERAIVESDNRLLNAFQLVKNGKQISHLKFDEFKNLMDTKHDHEGNAVNQLNEVDDE